MVGQMMKPRIVLAFCFFAATTALALAQPQPTNPFEERIKAQLGELVFNNGLLSSQLEHMQKAGAELQVKHDALVKENAELKAQIEELKKATK